MILITGATGLVGSHLLLYLLTENPDDKITALYRSETKKQKIINWLLYKNKNLNLNNIIWKQIDITDIPELEIAFQEINYVYHCAAIVDFAPKHKDLLNKVNIEGTANIVNLSLTYNIKKLCYVSSIATLSEPKIGHIIDETCEWNPENFNGDYAISKNGGEIEVWRGIYEGLNAVIVNPGVIIGDGLWDSGSADLFNQVNKGLPFYTKGTTGFIAVTDVVKCMAMLMQSKNTAERYILVESCPTFQQVINTIAQSLNKPKPKIYAHNFLLQFAYFLDILVCLFTSKKQQLTKDSIKASQSITIYNNSKIKETLNIEFTPILNYIETVSKEYLKYKNM